MAGRVHEIAFKIAGKIAANFSGTFKTAAATVKQFGDSVRGMNAEAAQIDKIVRMRKEVITASQDFNKTKQNATELGKSFALSKQRAETLRQEFAKSNAETERLASVMKGIKNPSAELSRAFENSRLKTSMLSNAMKEAEAESKKLGDEFNRERTASNKAEQQLLEQRAALQNLERSAGTAGQSLKQLRDRQNELMASAEKARAAQERFNASIAGMKGAAAGMKETAMYAGMTGAAMGAGLKAAIDAGMNFEQTMSGVAAVSRASAGDLAKMSAQAKQLGADTEWSASQAAEGMQFLAMAGFKTNDILKAMPGMLSLATAGSIDLGRAADIASNILTGFGMDAAEMGRVGDVLTNTFTSSNTTLEMLGQTMKYAAPVAQSMGVSIEEAAAMAGKLGDAGIQGEMAGTALRAVMLRLSAPSAKGAKALKDLGVSTTDASGNMRSFQDILADLNKAMDGMSESARVNYTKAIFETEAMSGAMVLMEQAGKGSLQTFTESLKKSGTAADTARGKNANLAGDMKSLMSKVEAVSISIYDTLVPSLRAMAQKATEIISKTNKWITENQGLAKAFAFIAGGVAVATAAVLPLMMLWKTMVFYGNALKFAGYAVSLMFQKQTYSIIASKAAMFASAIATKAATVAQWLLNSAFWACPITWIVAGILAVVAAAVLLYKNWDIVKAKMLALWTAFSEKFPNLAQIVKMYVGMMVAQFKVAWAIIKTIFSNMMIYVKILAAVFMNNLKVIWNIVKIVFGAIKTHVTNLLTVLDNIIGFVKNVFTGQWSAAWDNVKNIFGAVFSSLVSLVKTPLNAVLAIVNGVISNINSILGAVKIPDWVPVIGGKGIDMSIPQIPMLEDGGIATKPTMAMIGEGKENEAVMPLSKLNGMMANNPVAKTGGQVKYQSLNTAEEIAAKRAKMHERAKDDRGYKTMSDYLEARERNKQELRDLRGSNAVTFNATINVSGGGQDVYENARRGVEDASKNLQREMEKILANKQRLSYA
jgi:TP901 family phage tail tape measure protein